MEIQIEPLILDLEKLSTNNLQVDNSSNFVNIAYGGEIKKLPIITDLKVEDIDIKNDKLDKFATLLNEHKIDIYEYLPKKKAKKVSFILNETAAFANFIRSCIWDNTPTWSLKVETSSIQTNDPFMLFDNLKQKIHGIPISQSIFNKAFIKDGDNIYKNFKASFSVTNDTTELRTITTRDMKFEYDGKEIKSEDFCSMIPIFRLQVGKRLSLEMNIERGYGFTDANKFNAVDSREYKILDYKHPSEGGPSSLTYDPMKFYISYTTYRNYDDPLELLELIIEDNLIRIDKLAEGLKRFSESKSSILHELNMQFIKTETQTNYTMDESYFFCGVLARLIFDSSLGTPEFVTYDARHLLEHTSFVRVQAENANERMLEACQRFSEKLKEIQTIIRKA
jgi:DNA-directed RNA polymerase subunit L